MTCQLLSGSSNKNPKMKNSRHVDTSLKMNRQCNGVNRLFPTSYKDLNTPPYVLDAACLSARHSVRKLDPKY